MFETVTLAPPDAIFGLNEAIRRDPRPDKINLGAGVYKDEEGRTPVLAAVKEAEGRILNNEESKKYLPIDGDPDFDRRVQQLLFGDEHELFEAGRVVTAQAPGGTGALRVAADFLQRLDGTKMWLSDPTWPNHPQIADAVGMPRESYPYFDSETNGLDFDGMIAALERTQSGDVVVLHGCCHNPTGVDPTADQWARIGEVLAERKAMPLVDFAYHGFKRSLVEDVGEWLPILCDRVPELAIASSYSKNFGLYNERIGALTVVAASAERAAAVQSQIKRSIRGLYSNPPVHGAAIVATILGDPELRQVWERELTEMRQRVRRMRELFVAGLDTRGVKLHPTGNDFIARQNGLFSFSRLSKQQVERVRDEAGIYMVASGRMNVAGMSEANMDRLCDAIAAVL